MGSVSKVRKSSCQDKILVFANILYGLLVLEIVLAFEWYNFFVRSMPTAATNSVFST